MDAEVIVVGAGPTGLMLAGELALAGVDVLLLEQRATPHGQSRGLGFTARAAETFDQRGLMSRFGETTVSTLGHFGGLPLDFSVLDGGFFAVRGVLQSTTEAVLEGWAREVGARIIRESTVTGLDDAGAGVSVDVRGPAGRVMLESAYLVGCDGGRSTVRGLAGFDFPGAEARLEMYLADVRGAGLRPRPLGEMVDGGMVMSAPLGNGIDRIIVCERGTPPRRDAAEPDWQQVSAAWWRLTGEDLTAYEALWVSAFTDAARQVSQYRRGRVLLAGDAAHTHLPAGGQGLSTGVQDATNLGWKLAATVHGWAPPGLLDTYHQERHPVGARLLMNTQAQGQLYLSDARMQPLRDVMSELIDLPEVARYLAGTVSGLDLRYPVGRGRHPLLGRRLPPHPLVGSRGMTSTTEVLHPARGVLLDLADDASVCDAVAGWSQRVDVITAVPPLDDGDGPLRDTTALLVRPDGYVAWTAPGSEQGLRQAIAGWFGAPGPAAVGRPDGPGVPARASHGSH